MSRFVSVCVWVMCSVHIVTLAVLIVAMALEGPRLLDCLGLR